MVEYLYTNDWGDFGLLSEVRNQIERTVVNSIRKKLEGRGYLICNDYGIPMFVNQSQAYIITIETTDYNTNSCSVLLNKDLSKLYLGGGTIILIRCPKNICKSADIICISIKSGNNKPYTVTRDGFVRIYANVKNKVSAKYTLSLLGKETFIDTVNAVNVVRYQNVKLRFILKDESKTFKNIKAVVSHIGILDDGKLNVIDYFSSSDVESLGEFQAMCWDLSGLVKSITGKDYKVQLFIDDSGCSFVLEGVA